MSEDEVRTVYIAQGSTFGLLNLLTAFDVIYWDDWTGCECENHAVRMLKKGILKCQKFDL